MNLETILSTYDEMFGKNSLEEIESFLANKIFEAKSLSEQEIVVTLLNEIIGFCRDTTQKEKALKYCDELLELLDKLQLKGSVAYATSLLNIANAYRAFGAFDEALEFFETVQEIYGKYLAANDFNYASLYNNWSLLYQEMGAYENAVKMLHKALKIVDSYENALIPQATTRTNLAASLLQIGTEEAYGSAVKYLQQALTIFEADGGRDFHYGAALVAMGDACSHQKNFAEAAKYYAAGLDEIEKHTGKNDNYERVAEKFRYAKERVSQAKAASHTDTAISKQKQSNLERCREFFEAYGKEMLHTKFPEYETKIAVGMVGAGSDCFGFEDEISADHDFGLGFCIWLTESDYEEVGAAMQAAYEDLMTKFAPTDATDFRLKSRRGVFSINGFYNSLLGCALDFEKEEFMEQDGIVKLFETVEEFRLAEAVNGEVFCDSLGVFTSVRRKLSEYYPEQIWRRCLAQTMHDFSQYAQSNYPRMMARGDSLTALICMGKACEAAMDLAYLLERQYAPYYKWKRKGLERLAEQQKHSAGQDENFVAKAVLKLLEKVPAIPVQSAAWEKVKYQSSEVNLKDPNVALMEQIAAVLLDGLKQKKLIKFSFGVEETGREDVFLEAYIPQVLEEGKKSKENIENNSLFLAAAKLGQGQAEQGASDMDIVEKIVELEWKQFDKVKNEGGRADCQDNWGTFSIMRKSQYMAWNEEVLESFYNDLLIAESRGWNLIMEKYARMMKSTAPERYRELEEELPVLNEDRIAIQEEIIRIQVSWMEEFASKYPKMAGNARSIRTEEDNAFNTSYETYLRGEISTYSENTFVLYGRFITELLREGRNLAYEIMENTAKLYGYESVEDAERSLS